MLLGIVIITYNNPSLLLKQVECIKKFCSDQHEVVVVDNSTDRDVIAAIHYHATELKLRYIKTNASAKNGSGSHAFAANAAYSIIREDYTYLLFLDHDCFPIKRFSVRNILAGVKEIAGLGQDKNGKKYFWPGCVMFLNIRPSVKALIDFSTNKEFGLDTGGELYKIIDYIGEGCCVFFNEAYHENPGFTKTFYNFYSTINDEMFMHFINSSNWNPTDGNAERVNSLLNILEEKINA